MQEKKQKIQEKIVINNKTMKSCSSCGAFNTGPQPCSDAWCRHDMCLNATDADIDSIVSYPCRCVGTSWSLIGVGTDKHEAITRRYKRLLKAVHETRVSINETRDDRRSEINKYLKIHGLDVDCTTVDTFTNYAAVETGKITFADVVRAMAEEKYLNGYTNFREVVCGLMDDFNETTPTRLIRHNARVEVLEKTGGFPKVWPWMI